MDGRFVMDSTAGGETLRTAGESGWHLSRYNLYAPVPGKETTAIANLFRGTCAEYHPLELALLDEFEELPEGHPFIKRFAKRGVIANFDELAVLDSMGRGFCAITKAVRLAICPTMDCNFDCPYCFQGHRRGLMSPETQDDVVRLAERLLDASRAPEIYVSWFGGEPLVASSIVEGLSERLMALADERGCVYHGSIYTNGYLLTPKNVEMLGRVRVEEARITLDGIGAMHDATRHLVGGEPTFERIMGILRNQKLPFSVTVRQNVHEENKGQVEGLRSLVGRIAEESGNDLHYLSTPIWANDAADVRGSQVGIVSDAEKCAIGIMRDAADFQNARAGRCETQSLWALTVDESGRLHKCIESVEQPEMSFGTARDWDPENPFATADNPDMLSGFLNTAFPVPDEECRTCVWLPRCSGGCPRRRLMGQKMCLPYKDDPEAYVLAVLGYQQAAARH